MSLTVSLLTTAAIAVGAIAVTAGVVLTGPAPGSHVLAPPPNATPLEVDPRAVVDFDADGIIAAQTQGMIYRLTPQGERLGGPEPFSRRGGFSADGQWLAGSSCVDGRCSLLVIGSAQSSWTVEQVTVKLNAPFMTGEWAPAAGVFAAIDVEGNLYLVEPATLTARLLKPDVTTYAWGAGDRLLFATSEPGGSRLWRAGVNGPSVALASIDAPVSQLFASPDSSEFAFAQDDEAGWRLLSVRVDDGRLRQLARLGASVYRMEATAPAFAIAWSPDGSHLAVGPVTYPFFLHVLRLDSDGVPHHAFWLDKGYAGELKWSPDGSGLAISTYTPNRVWHEVFVLHMDALDDGPAFLLDGCEIVWSPDGRYLAVKREPARANAVAAIRVDSGEYWHVVQQPGLVPVAWGADGEAALQLASTPTRRSGQLGK